MPDDLSPFLPLSPAALHILLCLAAEPQHGYAIMQEVARQSEGQYRMGPGTMSQALVEEAPRPASNDDPRRRYYRLTGVGRRVLEADVERLKSVVREATVRLRQPKPKRA